MPEGQVPGPTIVGPSHAAVIAELHEATIGGGWSVASVQRLLALPSAFALLAFQAVERSASAPGPAGFAVCVPSGEAVEIAAIGVLAAARRQHLGRDMVRCALEHAAKLGFRQCLLEVAADNGAAIGLYHGCGFAEYATRPDYYRRPDGGRVDARLLTHPIEGKQGHF